MYQKKQKASLIISLVLILALVLTACSSKKAEDPEAAASNQPSIAPTDAQLPHVELTYYYPSPVIQKDLALVEAEMNKITEAKINTTIRLKTFDFGSFVDKLNVMTAAHDEYDLVFTAPWYNNYYQNVAKGAYIPLNDLLDKYAPTLKSTVPQPIWDATKINGNIYGAINMQIVAMPYGVSVKKDYLSKYSFDLTTVNKIADLEPLMAQIAKNEKGVYAQGLNFVSTPPMWGMDSIGDDLTVGWYSLKDPAIKVFNQYESPEFRELVKLAIDWQKKGYLNPDVNATDVNADFKAGKYAVQLNKPLKPGFNESDKGALAFDGEGRILSKALITTGRAIATMTAVSATSKNPERAIMFVELLNTDKALYNLIAHGREGIDYTFIDKEKGVIGLPSGVTADQVGYNPQQGLDWMFGNQFNSYYTSIEAVGDWEKTDELNKSADYAPSLGFNFDPEPVKAEIAQVNAVQTQYYSILLSGLATEDKLDEMISKMNKAGADKIIAEKQKQIDAWLAAK